MSFDFFFNLASLLMAIVLNHMQMAGVSPLNGTNLVAFYLDLIMKAAAQAAAL